MHQNSKNGQKSAKSAKIMKKIDCPYNNFPKKDISLRNAPPKKYFAFGEKKIKKVFAPAALYRCPPGGGGAIEFLDSGIPGFCPYT